MGQWNYLGPITYLKATLFAFNLTYWFFGVTLLAVALWAELHLHRYLELSPDFSGTATHLILSIAGLIIMVCSFAFTSIIRGQLVMLYLYAAFMGCILIMNAGVDLSMLCFWDTFRKSLRDGLTQTIMIDDPDKANFDFAQRYFHCCGVSNYTDWKTLSPQKVIPISCCVDLNNCVTANYSDVYQHGCYGVILTYVDQHLAFLIALAICTAVMPCFGMFLTCYLVYHIKKNKDGEAN